MITTYVIKFMITPYQQNILFQKLIDYTKQNDLKQVEHLFNLGANIRAEDDMLMYIAARKGYIDILDFFIKSGCDIHAKEEIALRQACTVRHLDLVRYLVENGANIHILNEVSIRNAARHGHIDIVDYLISQGSSEEQAYIYANDIVKKYLYAKTLAKGLDSSLAQNAYRKNIRKKL